MAEPYLKTPTNWHSGTLEPNPKKELIIRVDSGSTPSTRDPKNWNGEIPWLTPKEVTGSFDNIFVSRTERMLSKQGLRSATLKLQPPGTVMLTKRAPVGAVCVNTIPMTTNQGFLNFECGRRLRPLYLAYWFKVNKPYLDLVANGSVYPELYKSDLFEFHLSVPEVEVQDAILKIIAAFQYAIQLGTALERMAETPEQIIAIQEQNLRLIRIRDVMLPKLLSGELSVSAVNRKFEARHE